MDSTPTGESIQNLVRKYERHLVAEFDLITNSGIRIPGFKVMSGKNGLFISEPQHKTETGWKKLVTVPAVVRSSLVTLALQVINSRRKKEKEEKQASKPAWTAPEPSKRAKKEAEHQEWKRKNSHTLAKS